MHYGDTMKLLRRAICLFVRRFIYDDEDVRQAYNREFK